MGYYMFVIVQNILITNIFLNSFNQIINGPLDKYEFVCFQDVNH